MQLSSRFTLAAALLLAASPAFAAEKKKITPKPAKAEQPKAAATTAGVAGWISWRGPAQNGTSPETGLPDKIDGKKPLWTADFPGQSAPVIFKGKLYINGIQGDGPDLREGVA